MPGRIPGLLFCPVFPGKFVDLWKSESVHAPAGQSRGAIFF
jgi:hypothetical protein